MYIKIQLSVEKGWHKSVTSVATLAKHVTVEYSL